MFVAIVLAWFTTFAVGASAVGIGLWESLTPILARVTGLVLVGFAIWLAARL